MITKISGVNFNLASKQSYNISLSFKNNDKYSSEMQEALQILENRIQINTGESNSNEVLNALSQRLKKLQARYDDKELSVFCQKVTERLVVSSEKSFVRIETKGSDKGLVTEVYVHNWGKKKEEILFKIEDGFIIHNAIKGPSMFPPEFCLYN